jgi:hypothetical protein
MTKTKNLSYVTGPDLSMGSSRVIFCSRHGIILPAETFEMEKFLSITARPREKAKQF